jgi:hypothetical protein
MLGIPECANISVPICENSAPAVGLVWQHNACEQAIRPDNKASGRSQSFGTAMLRAAVSIPPFSACQWLAKWSVLVSTTQIMKD